MGDALDRVQVHSTAARKFNEIGPGRTYRSVSSSSRSGNLHQKLNTPELVWW